MAPPDDYGRGEEPPSDDDDAALKRWLFWVGVLTALALLVVGYVRATKGI